MAQVLALVAFVLIIFGVPIAQGIIDLSEEDGELQVAALFEEAPTEEHLRSFEKDLEENSYFEQTLRPVFQRARYRLVGDLGEKALGGSDGWFFYTPGVRYLVQPYPTDLTHNVNDGEQDAEGPVDPLPAIVDFRNQLKARGIELLVVPIPGKASIYPDRLVSGLVPQLGMFAHTQRLVKQMRAKGMDVLTLHQAFVAQRDSRQLYMATDTHWTGHGVRIAAALVADRIRREGWLGKRAPQKRYVRRQVELRRDGDIPRMTRIPNEDGLFPQERVQCFKVFEAKSGEAYEDGENARVLLLGDSFSRIFQTDEPESAGVIANLAFELQEPLKSIVNDGGASTLVRQELARDLEQLDNVEVVVWAFIERDIRFGMRGWQVLALADEE